MNKLILIIVVMSTVLFVSTAYSQRVNPRKGPDGCQKSLEMCVDDLDVCETDLIQCQGNSQILPGDGYSIPDPSNTINHGPALSYTDNGDGTFTDNNTGCMWEKKDDAGGVHDKDNLYTCSQVVFTISDFIDIMNNKCDGDETTPCTVDADCTSIGNELCGHAGYTDWVIPNIKQLQTLVDYSKFEPASSVPGDISAGISTYWSITSFDGGNAWVVNFVAGVVTPSGKVDFLSARVVRECS